MTTTPAPIKSDDLPAANCTLPELYVDELEPYQEYSRIEILANLRVLIDRHVLTTVYFDQGASFIITRILGFTADFEELIFDLSPDAKTNEKLQESSDLTMVAFFNHIKVQFTVNRAVLTQFENAPALRVGLPRSLLRLQRRTAFRAHAGGQQPRCVAAADYRCARHARNRTSQGCRYQRHRIRLCRACREAGPDGRHATRGV